MIPRFGTDGIRGVANAELTPELVLALGRAAAPVLAGGVEGRPSVVVGRDTRASGPLLVAALAAGLASAGADVLDVGVVPTGCVAVLVRELGATAGAVVSASHNPAPDNGVKFFAAAGQKLPDEVEAAVEAGLEAVLAGGFPGGRPTAGDVGAITSALDAVERYRSVLSATVDTPLAGLHVVVDTANGAAHVVGPAALAAAGATVDVVNDNPDGLNINAACGATAPEGLATTVTERGAHVGLAFDGDADRLIAVDEAGRVVDGDHVMALLAVDRKERGRLPGDAIVATVMSNLGLRLAMREHGIDVVESPVGDRNVLVELERHGLVLGGEQSGHVVFTDLAPTGDGVLTALQVCQAMVRSGRPLSELAAVMTRLPQVLVNVPLADRSRLDGAVALWAAVKAVEGELGDTGRVLVRPSGTEPKLRIMAEAPSEATAQDAVDRVAAAARTLA